jgi:hypothetical protein
MEVACRHLDLGDRLLDYAAAIIRFDETMTRTQAGSHATVRKRAPRKGGASGR